MPDLLAGRELAIAVARQVFGQDVPDLPPDAWRWEGGSDPPCWLGKVDDEYWVSVDACPERMDAAWRVVERMQELGLEAVFVIQLVAIAGENDIRPGIQSLTRMVNANHMGLMYLLFNQIPAPVLICHAALAAVRA